MRISARCRALAFVLAGSSLLLLAMARAEEPTEPSGEKTASPSTETPAPGEGLDTITEAIPEEMKDPAFEKFVDLKLLGQAWNDLNPSLFTDAVLLLKEGERVLGRPHKGVNSDELLATAVRLAGQQKDKATLDRLAKVAEKAGNEKLSGLITITKAGMNKSRAAPSVAINLDELTPESIATYRLVSKQIQAAEIASDRETLDVLDSGLEGRADLNPKQREALRKMIEAARASVPKVTEAKEPDVPEGTSPPRRSKRPRKCSSCSPSPTGLRPRSR